MAISMITAPVVEPISRADAKMYVREDYTHQDDLIDRLIAAARDRAERFTRTQMITQTWRITLDSFPSAIIIPLWPVQSISQITYLDGDGLEQTLGASKYQLVTSRRPNLVAPTYLEVWPVARTDFDAVKVDVIVGHGDAGSDVPENLVQAMHLMIGEMEAGRQDDETVSRRAEALMKPHIFWV